MNQISNIIEFILIHDIFDVWKLSDDLTLINPSTDHLDQSLIFGKVIQWFLTRLFKNVTLFIVPSLQKEELKGKEESIVNHTECQLRSPCIVIDPPS